MRNVTDTNEKIENDISSVVNNSSKLRSLFNQNGTKE